MPANHKVVKHAAPASVSADGFVFSPGERQLLDAVREGYYIAFGDDNLRLICGGKNFCRIANPNMESYNFYSLTPFAGFNGAKYLLQWLMNFKGPGRKVPADKAGQIFQLSRPKDLPPVNCRRQVLSFHLPRRLL